MWHHVANDGSVDFHELLPLEAPVAFPIVSFYLSVSFTHAHRHLVKSFISGTARAALCNVSHVCFFLKCF